MHASSDGNVEEMMQALRAGAPVDKRRTLVMRTQFDDEDVAADVLSRSPYHRVDDTRCLPGLTPLMRAANGGYPEAVKVLIGAHANIKARDEDGMQPLHFAAAALCKASCQFLLEARTDPFSE